MRQFPLAAAVALCLAGTAGAAPLSGQMTAYWKSTSGTADAFDVLVYGNLVSTGPITYRMATPNQPIVFDFDTMTVSYTELLEFNAPLLESLGAPPQLAQFEVSGSFSVSPDDLTPETPTDVTFSFGPQDGAGYFLDGQLLSGITYNNAKGVEDIVVPIVVHFIPAEIKFGVFIACQLIDDLECDTIDDLIYNATYSAVVSIDNVDDDNPVFDLPGPTAISSVESGVISPVPVPVPAGALLMGSAICLLAGRRLWRG